MKCKGKICCRAVFSVSVTNSDGTLIINVPQRSFNNGECVCLFVTQSIPAATPTGSPVVITIGSSTTQYPLVRCDCTQVTACGIRTRTRYPLKVVTTATGASFKVLRNLCCMPDNSLASIPVTAATPAGGAA